MGKNKKTAVIPIDAIRMWMQIEANLPHSAECGLMLAKSFYRLNFALAYWEQKGGHSDPPRTSTSDVCTAQQELENQKCPCERRQTAPRSRKGRKTR